jgi:hypothetical protein
MDFDGLRYFDVRKLPQVFHHYSDLPSEKSLASDSTKRLDLILLAANALEAAQKVKDDIELQQRTDRHKREAAHERRLKGG